jgi:hypothetical protein
MEVIMKTCLTSVHMGDCLGRIGCQIDLPTADRKMATFTLNSAELADDRIILGLDSVTVRLPLDQAVCLWTARTKVAHTRCSGGCRKNRDHAHPHSYTESSALPQYIGAYAFLEGGNTVGPHRLLSAAVEGDEVVVQLTAEEAIAPIDHRVAIHVPVDTASTN